MIDMYSLGTSNQIGFDNKGNLVKLVMNNIIQKEYKQMIDAGVIGWMCDICWQAAACTGMANSDILTIIPWKGGKTRWSNTGCSSKPIEERCRTVRFHKKAKPQKFAWPAMPAAGQGLPYTRYAVPPLPRGFAMPCRPLVAFLCHPHAKRLLLSHDRNNA